MNNCAIQIEIENCSNACIFCHPQGFKDYEKKNAKEIALHIYRQAIDLRLKGFEVVEISGHDPIQFEHIVGFMVWLKQIGFKKIILATHGRDLCDASLAKKFSKIDLLLLRIPLYGSSAQIHNYVTNSKNSFQETMQGLKNIKKYAPLTELHFHTLIMKENFSNITNIIHLFSTFQPANVTIKMPYIPHNIFAQKSAVSFSSLKPYINDWYNLCKEKCNGHFEFSTIPFCIFGFYDEHIVEDHVPPMAKNYSVPEVHKTKMHGVPKYRLRQKLKMCSTCKYTDRCSGFIRDYVKRFNMKQDSTLKPL